MNFVETRNPAGKLIDIRVQHVVFDKLLRILTDVPNTVILFATQCWPPLTNEAARIQIGRSQFVIETSFADRFIGPVNGNQSPDAFEMLASHLRAAKEKYRESLP